MARVKLSEYDAKRLLLPALKNQVHLLAASPATTTKELSAHFPETNLVVKVDQGIKKRGKRGLIKINCTPQEVVTAIKEWSKQGWTHFLVEPVVEHSPDAEHYLALERTREGWKPTYGEQGGIEVESAWDRVTDHVEASLKKLLDSQLIPALEKYHLVFLEMNPVLIRQGKLIPLDMAAEIDDTTLNLPELVSLNVRPVEDRRQSSIEKEIANLDASTPASLKFRLINARGAIWMLLSGGGASLVLADEVTDQGMGEELANYGEYSGAPTDDDVYAYTKLVLSALLKSGAPKKALVIAGGVANFTDVVKTFKGIIRALDEQQGRLRQAKVKVFVRRGGPNEAKGLANMEAFLNQAKLLGAVHGHTTPLTEVVSEVRAYL